MRTLIFGNGWLGNRFAEHFDARVSDVDILDTERVASVLLDIKPEVVINTAGKCGRPNIDWCEASEENRRLTFYVNTCGPAILYHVVEGIGEHIRKPIFFVHLSSGCLWNHKYDVDEQTRPEPPSYYSDTKAMGDTRLPQDRVLILRLRMPTDDKPHPRNLITKLLSYQYVLDERNSVTFVDDLLRAAGALIERRRTGIYNVVNSGSISPWDIMCLYREIVGTSHPHAFERVTLDELGQRGLIKAGRSNCTLSIDKLLAEGIEMPDAAVKMRECLKRYGENCS